MNLEAEDRGKILKIKKNYEFMMNEIWLLSWWYKKKPMMDTLVGKTQIPRPWV